MMSFIKLTEDEFEVQFKPVENLEQGQGVYQFDAYDEKDNTAVPLIFTAEPFD